MKKLLLILASVLMAYQADAQCGARYRDSIFAGYTKTTDTFSTTNQAMDIYVPTGDLQYNRPVIILAHGGTFVGGDKTDYTVAELCKRFAKRGYVTASYNYRLGIVAQLLDSTTAFPVVVKALSDAKAAVRYFKADATGANKYRVDTNQVFLGGNSAGAVIAVNYAYLDDTLKATPGLRNAINANGGLEGNSGNANHSSKVKAVVNLAGATLYVNWIDNANQEPIVSLHGDADGTVPYMCGQVLGGLSDITLCGSGAIETQLVAKSVPHVLKTFPGANHVPWDTNAVMFNTMDSIVTAFLYSNVSCTTLGTSNLTNNESFELYPNPAQSFVKVAITGVAEVETVKMYDAVGRVNFVATVADKSLTIPTDNLQNGIYFVEAKLKNDQRIVKRLEVVK